MVRGNVVVHPNNPTGVQELIQQSALGKLPSDMDGYIAVLYDHKQSGESNARPHIRKVAFRSEFCDASVRCGLCAFSEDGDGNTFPPHVVFIALDGGVHGNEAPLTSKPFVNKAGKVLPKQRNQLFITTTESSVKAAKKLIRGSVNTVEFCWIMSADCLDVEDRARIHFPDKTTRGNTLGDFVQPCSTTPGILMVQHSEKPKYYGKALRECGGRVEGDPGQGASKGPVATETVPFNWHMNDPRLWDELSDQSLGEPYGIRWILGRALCGDRATILRVCPHARAQDSSR